MLVMGWSIKTKYLISPACCGRDPSQQDPPYPHTSASPETPPPAEGSAPVFPESSGMTLSAILTVGSQPGDRACAGDLRLPVCCAGGGKRFLGFCGQDDPGGEGRRGEREGEGRREGKGAARREAAHRTCPGARVPAGG